MNSSFLLHASSKHGQELWFITWHSFYSSVIIKDTTYIIILVGLSDTFVKPMLFKWVLGQFSFWTYSESNL